MKEKLDTVQLKGSRQILGLKTTFIDRNNSNEEVYKQAECAVGKVDNALPMSIYYEQQKRKLLGHIFREVDDNHEKYTTLFPESHKPRLNPVLRVGKPKENWAVNGIEYVWRDLQEETGEDDEEYDINKTQHTTAIDLMAHLRMF